MESSTQKILIVVGGVAVIGLVYWWWSSTQAASATAAPGAVAPGTAAATPATIPAHLTNWISRTKASWQAVMPSILAQMSQADITMFDQVTTAFDYNTPLTTAQQTWWNALTAKYNLNSLP